MTSYRDLINPMDLETFLQSRGVSTQQREPLATVVPGGSPINTTSAAQQPSVVPEPPTEMGRVIATIQHQEAQKRKRLEEYLSRARGGMQGLEQAQMAQLQQPSQVDISPLLALSDSLSPGGKILSGYQKPPTSQEVSQQGLGNLIALQQRREALTNLAEGADASGSNYLKLLAAQAKDKGTQERFDTRQLFQQEEIVRKDLDKSVHAPIAQRSEQFANIDDALASGEYQKIWANIAQMSRGISGEKGVLTDYDIQRIMPKNIYGDVSRIKAYFSETPSDKMDPAYVEKLRELVQTAKANAVKVYGDLLTTKENVYSKTKTYQPLFQEGGSGKAMFNETRESLKRFTGMSKPPQVSDADWAQATEEEKRALYEHFK